MSIAFLVLTYNFAESILKHLLAKTAKLWVKSQHICWSFSFKVWRRWDVYIHAFVMALTIS